MQVESNQTTHSEYFHGRAASQQEVTGSGHPVIGTGTALGASHANYTEQRQAGVAAAEKRLENKVLSEGIGSLRSARQRVRYQRMLERRARFDAAQRSAERHARFQLAQQLREERRCHDRERYGDYYESDSEEEDPGPSEEPAQQRRRLPIARTVGPPKYDHAYAYDCCLILCTMHICLLLQYV